MQLRGIHRLAACLVRLRVALLGTFLLRAAPTARAQWSAARFEQLTHTALAAPGPLAAPATVAPAAARHLGYTPTDAARRAAVAAHVQQLYAGRPELAAAMTTALGPGGASDYTPRYQRLVAGSALRDDNSADALAAYVAALYRVASGEAARTTLLLPNQLGAVRAQVAAGAAQATASQSPGQVAAWGEQLKLETELLAIQPALGDLARSGMQRIAAARFRQLLGLEASTVQLTSQGFRRQ